MNITESQIRVLESLAEFKFLTVAHMQTLGVQSHAQNIRTSVRALERSAYIGVRDLGALPTYGRLKKIFYLKNKGKKFLVDHDIMEEESIRIPSEKGRKIVERDYKHRLSVIDAHIALNRWLKNFEDTAIVHRSSYFDQHGSQRNNDTVKHNKVILSEGKKEYIIPDFLAVYRINNNTHAIALEQHNGKDTKKLLKQISAYCTAIENGSISDHLNIQKAVRILVVFEHESIMQATIARLDEVEGIRDFGNHFYFKTGVETNFNEWFDVNGEKACLYVL